MRISVEFLTIVGIAVLFVSYSIYKKYSHKKLLKEVNKLEAEGKLIPPANLDILNEKS